MTSNHVKRNALFLLTCSIAGLLLASISSADVLTVTHTDRADSIEAQGNNFLVNDEYAKALPLIKKAISLKPRREAYYNDLGVCYSQMGNKAGAISAYRGALKLKPNDPLVLNNLAIALNQTGHHAEAVKYAKLAIKADPNDQSGNAFMNAIIHP